MVIMEKEKIMTKNTSELLAEFFEIIDAVETADEGDEQHPLFTHKPSKVEGFKPNRVICCDQQTQRQVNELLDVLRSHVK